MKHQLLLLVLLGACETSPRPEPAPAPKTRAPTDELDQLDQRRPLPLLPMMAHHQKQSMRAHLVDVQGVIVAAAKQDFAEVAVAAQRLGYSEAMGRMCEHLGAGAPGFTERALAFHHSADRIVEAAKREDAPAVLGALGDTLGHCTSCHEGYKQRLIGE
jgi:hypothetical protein